MHSVLIADTSAPATYFFPRRRLYEPEAEPAINENMMTNITIKYLGGMVGSALGDAIGEIAFPIS